MENEVITDLAMQSYNHFNVIPCHWQLQVAFQLLQRRDLVATAATGDGKTFTFWLPLLREPKKVTFVVAPLKALAEQHAESAKALGVTAISLTRDTMSKETLKVLQSSG